MQSQKKHLLEGLMIQAALLLSLCGVRVDVGLDPGPLPWSESLILGPTSALTPTHLHNLRNALEGGAELHPKHPDLDAFFTSRRLLGFVRSLDRLQVPQAELETWLVQQDPAPLPVRLHHTAPNRLILPEQTRDQDWPRPETSPETRTGPRPGDEPRDQDWAETGDEPRDQDWAESGDEPREQQWDEPEDFHTQVQLSSEQSRKTCLVFTFL
ncbi:endoplasmic reticulum membrane sensor NFE2L1-like [Boleophthalmus pectinirostris]|uniref:endoplasmic reticulum membrane sensor NFE2L1-like n=1 Tax=Boleophthalmus pectinirostris TaxID=150288 RepID=UPI00242D2176|nr:endoplasmic reticulum membrane sensor NFE2L1-like [Boleophthalmus pectinirostris]